MPLPTNKPHEPTPEMVSAIVMWVDQDASTLAAAARLFSSQTWTFIPVKTSLEAFEVLKKSEVSVVLVDEKMTAVSALDFLSQIKNISPNTSRILVAQKFSQEMILESVNRAGVFRFIAKPWKEADLLLDIQRAIEHAANMAQARKLYREVTRQNKELEVVTQNLEQLVAERTFHIEVSTEEQREKLARVRALIRFIKELTSLSTIEEVMQEFRKELRKFHKLSDPILVYRSSKDAVSALSFRSGVVHNTDLRQDFQFPERDYVNEQGSSQLMASLLSRPFGKVILLPLGFHPKEEAGEKFEALLCLEHSLSDMELGGLIDFISERLQPLSLAIDRILLEYQMTSVSYRWEKTFDGIQNPIAIIDLDYRVLRSNRHFSQKSAKKRCFESFAGREEPCIGCPAPEALRKGEHHSGQIAVGERLYEVHSYPIKLQGEQASTNVVNHYVDITQARELTSRMIQNEKMGAIGLLAGNIAHELNNPLTGIRSLTQTLLAEVEKESSLYLDLLEVERAASRSQVIIKNLLEFSTGKEGMRLKVELDELVNKTMPMLKTALRSHRCDVSLNAAGAQVDVEPHLVQQVIFNLVNNACQAMKTPGTIRLFTSRLDANSIELRVEDTGPGIPEDIQNRIFEPFFTTKKEGAGTGLGLSMSKTVIERFGGKIGVQSISGQGSQFWIQLPIVKAL